MNILCFLLMQWDSQGTTSEVTDKHGSDCRQKVGGGGFYRKPYSRQRRLVTSWTAESWLSTVKILTFWGLFSVCQNPDGLLSKSLGTLWRKWEFEPKGLWQHLGIIWPRLLHCCRHWLKVVFQAWPLLQSWIRACECRHFHTFSSLQSAVCVPWSFRLKLVTRELTAFLQWDQVRLAVCLTHCWAPAGTFWITLPSCDDGFSCVFFTDHFLWGKLADVAEVVTHQQ